MANMLLRFTDEDLVEIPERRKDQIGSNDSMISLTEACGPGGISVDEAMAGYEPVYMKVVYRDPRNNLYWVNKTCSTMSGD